MPASRSATSKARLVRLVEVRFFVGLSVGESAEALDVSARTVKRLAESARPPAPRAHRRGLAMGAGTRLPACNKIVCDQNVPAVVLK